MIRLSQEGAYVLNGALVVEEGEIHDGDRLEARCRELDLPVPDTDKFAKESAKKGTIAHGILTEHNHSDDIDNLKIRFDSLVSHDITYVGIIQTARASGMEVFPVPFALTNCHNTLCAVGGTINEDDHVFGLSAAKKYGGIYVPTHMAVIHQYAREMMSSCGTMILGSDSHTRYGALGTMAIGEGGPELVKQLLERTYDIPYPEVIGVYLEGSPQPGTGPHDVALAIIGAVFDSGYVKNKVMEFIGPGVANLSVDFRNGIDVMTTETTCLSSIWQTDERVAQFYQIHGRPSSFTELSPRNVAYYDGLVHVDLSSIKPMIALPFHPSNVHEIDEFNENAADILRQVEIEAESIFDSQNVELNLTGKVNGGVKVDQGIIAGCSGGLFENVCAVADVITERQLSPSDFGLSVYPASQPVNLALMKNRTIEELVGGGIVTRTAFCGPCFGAGETPASGAFSIRHTTRNFPSREGAKPGEGQISAVALMDARSIAATYVNGGVLTSAAEFSDFAESYDYKYDGLVYEQKVFNGYGKPRKDDPLVMGPNIVDWPEVDPLPEHLLLRAASILHDPVTTTDELIPSGETSSYRSNPMRLAEFTLSRKDPGYVTRAKEIQQLYRGAKQGLPEELKPVFAIISNDIDGVGEATALDQVTGIGSLVVSIKPGDGSAREQAASCQKVLGTWANIAREYATKRYRSNCINWGILPLISASEITDLSLGSYIFLPGIRNTIESGGEAVDGWLINGDTVRPLSLSIPDLTEKDREVLLAGNLINYHSADK